jgi:hypothetical protein
MKMPAPKGVITVFSDQQETRNIEKGHTPGQTNVHQLNSAEEKKEPYIEAKRDKEKIEIAVDGEIKKVYLDDMPDRAVMVGAHLSPEEENELMRFLNKNKDVFAWSAKDLQGVDRDIIEYTLRHVNFHVKPIRAPVFGEVSFATGSKLNSSQTLS